MDKVASHLSISKTKDVGTLKNAKAVLEKKLEVLKARSATDNWSKEMIPKTYAKIAEIDAKIAQINSPQQNNKKFSLKRWISESKLPLAKAIATSQNKDTSNIAAPKTKNQ